MAKLVDLIIPVYNVSPYLRECLDSVVNQTFKEFRALIVDDGSTDGSGLICDQYAEQYPFISVIHQKNMGLSGAKNTGLQLSEAPYIMFLDSDDWISPETIETLYNIAVKHDSDIVQCKSILEYGEMKEQALNIQNFVAKDMDVETVYKSIFSGKGVGPASWGKIYKSEVLENLKFPVGKVHEDVAVLGDLLSRITKFTFFDAPLWHYRYREESISRTHYAPKNKYLYDVIVDLEKVTKQYPSLEPYYEGYKLLVAKSLLIMFTKEDIEANRADYELYVNVIKSSRLSVLGNSTISFTNKMSILLATSKLHSVLKQIFIKK